jgi:hypothetical protein
MLKTVFSRGGDRHFSRSHAHVAGLASGLPTRLVVRLATGHVRVLLAVGPVLDRIEERANIYIHDTRCETEAVVVDCQREQENVLSPMASLLAPAAALRPKLASTELKLPLCKAFTSDPMLWRS